MRELSPRLYSWASIIDDQALAQAQLTAERPFIDPHVVLMPDAHVGMGATVGSVIPTSGAVIPAAVGVDIGCGMVAVRTQFTEAQLRGGRRPLAQLRAAIERVIPLGGGRDNRKVSDAALPAVAQLEALATDQGVEPAQFVKQWRRQLGSLGGGNHFIEITADTGGMVWAFLHSGSRGVGNQIARRFIAIAKELAQQREADLPDANLAHLGTQDAAYHDYLAHLHWAQEFARLNRQVMIERVLGELGRFLGQDAQRTDEIDCHHNYTATEEHFGRTLLISRKGAIAAHDGVRGLIPGSMGTASYVVRGRGEEMSLCSAPHGAGRVYSRTRARKTFSHEDLRRRMAGIEYRDLADFVDEIPDAYKDIDVVMADAADLVSVQQELHQIINIKGP